MDPETASVIAQLPPGATAGADAPPEQPTFLSMEVVAQQFGKGLADLATLVEARVEARTDAKLREEMQKFERTAMLRLEVIAKQIAEREQAVLLEKVSRSFVEEFSTRAQGCRKKGSTEAGAAKIWSPSSRVTSSWQG